MDDRVLVHLQITVHEMFRQRSNFYLSWVKPKEQGSGRVSILLTPGVHLTFVFDGNRIPRVNPAWIHHLLTHALSGTGLVLLPEPPPQAGPSAPPHPAPRSPRR